MTMTKKQATIAKGKVNAVDHARRYHRVCSESTGAAADAHRARQRDGNAKRDTVNEFGETAVHVRHLQALKKMIARCKTAAFCCTCTILYA